MNIDEEVHVVLCRRLCISSEYKERGKHLKNMQKGKFGLFMLCHTTTTMPISICIVIRLYILELLDVGFHFSSMINGVILSPKISLLFMIIFD